MKASVRMVCGGCLRSVEVSATSTADSVESMSSLRWADRERLEPGQSTERGGRETPTTVTPSLADRDRRTDRLGARPGHAARSGHLGRFQLRERLGDGGFGQVFRAYDPRLDRDVAIKVLKQPNPSERVMERFFREARAVARLDHPNIVAVHDAGFDNDRCWVAYQLVGGRPLWWYRDHHRMDAMTVARIIRALADALDHSHHMGVVHRDIKPATC